MLRRFSPPQVEKKDTRRLTARAESVCVDHVAAANAAFGGAEDENVCASAAWTGEVGCAARPPSARRLPKQ